MGSRDLEIWVSSPSFQKSNKDWPQQPLTEKLSNISEKLNFWRSVSQKGTGIGHLGAWCETTIRLSKFFGERHHKLKQLWNLLPLTADLLFTLQCEIPCIYKSKILWLSMQQKLTTLKLFLRKQMDIWQATKKPKWL